MSVDTFSDEQKIALLRAEQRRATRDGITQKEMRSPVETALAGYLAGLRMAERLIR
jgi:hypothetical protein